MQKMKLKDAEVVDRLRIDNTKPDQTLKYKPLEKPLFHKQDEPVHNENRRVITIEDDEEEHDD